MEQYENMRQLWHRIYVKSRGAVKILHRFGDLNRRIYLFGVSKKLDLVEEEIKPLPFIIMPDSKLKTFWNAIIAALLIYTATVVPYRTAFLDSASEGYKLFEYCVDALFFLDLIVNFVSAYEDKDKRIEVRLSYISVSYLKSWFAFDLVAW